MRKIKLWAMIGLATVLMAGCGEKAANTTGQNNSQDAQVTEGSEAATSDGNTGSEAQNDKDASSDTSDVASNADQAGAAETDSQASAENMTPVSLYSSMFSRIQRVNEKGECELAIDTSLFEGSTICYAYEDYLIYNTYEYYGDSYEGYYSFHGYNISTGEDTHLRDIDSYAYVDVFDGKVFLVTSNYETTEYLEFIYDAHTFAPVDEGDGKNSYDDIYGYSMITSNQSPYYNHTTCMRRALAEIGYAILQKDSRYYLYDGKEIQKISALQSNDTVRFYDKNCVIVSSYNDTNYTYEIKAMDFAGNWTKLTDDYYMEFGLENGVYYWAEEGDEYTYPTPYVRKYFDSKTGEIGELPAVEKHPGVSSYDPGITDFYAVGDDVFYTEDDGTDIYWVRIAKDASGKYVKNRVGDLLKQADLLEFGKAETLSLVKVCPYCNRPLYKEYLEYFQMDPAYSVDYQAINDALKAQAMEKIQETGLVVDRSIEDDSMCEDTHSQDWSLETMTTEIGNVDFIGAIFMAVDTYGYWYGGGAHGYPSESQILINMADGKLVTFTDLYTGSEADLRRVVAKANAEKWKACQNDSDDYWYYEGSTYDSVYAETYDGLVPEYMNVRFTNEGLQVIFSPYEFGPYASGFLYVDIPYEDLGMRETMTILPQ